MIVEVSKNQDKLQELAKELGIRVDLIYRRRIDYIDKDEGSFLGLKMLRQPN